MQWVFSVLFLFMHLASVAYGAAPHGYVDDVKAERNERFTEIFLFAQPPPKMTRLSEAIFNPELSKEFRVKYREKFGSVDTDSINYQRSDYDRLDLYKGNNAQLEAQNEKRRSYAEYMMKRLFEWHVDNYIKSEPSMRPVYELKEKLKKVEVKVTKQTKLEARYSLAGNTLDVIFDNPYCDAKWIVQMDPGAFGPASIEENSVVIGRPLTTTLRTENTWTDLDRRSRLELIKAHTLNFSTTYGVSAAYAESKYTGESRVAWGMGYSF